MRQLSCSKNYVARVFATRREASLHEKIDLKGEGEAKRESNTDADENRRMIGRVVVYVGAEKKQTRFVAADEGRGGSRT